MVVGERVLQVLLVGVGLCVRKVHLLTPLLSFGQVVVLNGAASFGDDLARVNAESEPLDPTIEVSLVTAVTRLASVCSSCELILPAIPHSLILIIGVVLERLHVLVLEAGSVDLGGRDHLLKDLALLRESSNA